MLTRVILSVRFRSLANGPILLTLRIRWIGTSEMGITTSTRAESGVNYYIIHPVHGNEYNRQSHARINHNYHSVIAR